MQCLKSYFQTLRKNMNVTNFTFRIHKSLNYYYYYIIVV
jgi:hypothetical protein